MNVEDIVLIAFILLNTFGAALLTRLPLPKSWARIGPFVRFACIVVLLFVIASVDESTSRLLFHDLPRGTIFVRVFLVGGICTVIYLFMPQPTPGIVNGEGHAQVQAAQNEKLDKLLEQTLDRSTYEAQHAELEARVAERADEGRREREALSTRIAELEAQLATRKPRRGGGT